ncbi:hypothetical protein [Spirosoma foliorum]|uniref:Outer membrane protein beta-barrel domain-containing protein n=1 Tax=Spirosoma foliorum TaxID=2710596 RepID=A0A7G5GNE2_9BACT|nr:hypothetical protein [Spirosoma foliorum]QMW00384.1 hypothetical protein H3H32_20470 [Spirosoma foliorum]
MNRFITLLISLLLYTVSGKAQSTLSSNALSQSTGTVSQEAMPTKTAAAESPIYVKLYGVYGLLTPGVQIQYSQSQSQTGIAFPFKTTNKGLGAGPRAGVGIGLIASDFINIGIDADMLFGSAVNITNSYDDGTYSYTNSSSTTLKVVSVIPNITFKALSRPSYYIYNRLGLVGGVVLDYKTVTNGVSVAKNGTSNTFNSTNSYTSNSLALGYQAALGIQFRLSQAIRGFAEVVFYNQSFKPKRLEVTTANVIGGKPTTSLVVTDYIDEGSIVNSTTQPNKALSYNVAMNSVGVGAGLVFRF